MTERHPSASQMDRCADQHHEFDPETHRCVCGADDRVMTDDVRKLLGGPIYEPPVRERMKRVIERLKVAKSTLVHEDCLITEPRGTEWSVVKHEIAEAERMVVQAIERLTRMSERGELPPSQPMLMGASPSPLQPTGNREERRRRR